MTAAAFWHETTGGIEVRVRLTPKSSKDAINGTTDTADGPALKARVRAVPEDGKANAAVATLLARWLEVPPSSVTLVAGLKSRVKTLAVAGDTVVLARRIAERSLELDRGD